MIGKLLHGFLPLGPYLVTADTIKDPQTLGIRCRDNGELMQDSSTSDMIFGVAEIIAFLSDSVRGANGKRDFNGRATHLPIERPTFRHPS